MGFIRRGLCRAELGAFGLISQLNTHTTLGPALCRRDISLYIAYKTKLTATLFADSFLLFALIVCMSRCAFSERPNNQQPSEFGVFSVSSFLSHALRSLAKLM